MCDATPSDDIIRKSRLLACEVCNKNDAKYTCPKCEVKTCRLDCVIIHKKELGCDGIRDRTKFVSLKDFSSTDFYRDYTFLEECSRFVYGKQRNIAKRYTHIDKPLPHHLNRLKRAARERGTVLLFLPEHFVCRKNNTSRIGKGQLIFWRVDWLFGDYLVPNKGGPLKESTRLGQVLHERLLEDDPKLDCYRAAGVPNIRLFLKADRIKGCSGKYYELDSDLSIAQNLVGKCLVEYPTVHALLRDHAYGLDLVNSDDESEAKEELICHQLTTEHTRAESPQSVDNSSVATDGKRPAEEREGTNNPSKKIHRELATVRVAREEREKIQQQVQQELKQKPRNLLFVTGYSSDEKSDMEMSGDEEL